MQCRDRLEPGHTRVKVFCFHVALFRFLGGTSSSIVFLPARELLVLAGHHGSCRKSAELSTSIGSRRKRTYQTLSELTGKKRRVGIEVLATYHGVTRKTIRRWADTERYNWHKTKSSFIQKFSERTNQQLYNLIKNRPLYSQRKLTQAISRTTQVHMSKSYVSRLRRTYFKGLRIKVFDTNRHHADTLFNHRDDQY